jgi:hypothetical protein
VTTRRRLRVIILGLAFAAALGSPFSSRAGSGEDKCFYLKPRPPVTRQGSTICCVWAGPATPYWLQNQLSEIRDRLPHPHVCSYTPG